MISFIVLNHNNKNIIKACIDSIFQYSGDLEYELIVVDNHSGDGSSEFLRMEYAKKIRLYENPVNGCASGRNIGIAHANGDVICFLDSDQRAVRSGWLKPALDILNAHPEIGAVGWSGGWLRTDCTAGYTAEDFPAFFEESTRKISYLGTGGMVLRKETALCVNGFDERFDPAFFEDTDFSLKIVKAGFALCLCRKIGIVHHPHQTTGQLDFPLVFREKEEVFLDKWSGSGFIKNMVDTPRRMLILSFYNPFNGGGGQRPLAFLREAIRCGNEVAFVFESDSDMENMRSFALFDNPSLHLLRYDCATRAFIPINRHSEVFSSGEYLWNVWKPELILSHVPIAGLLDLFLRGKQLGIPTVYDQMDRWYAFPNDIFGAAEREYVENATVNLSITKVLADESAEKYGKNFFRFPNAVEKGFAERIRPSFADVQKRFSVSRKKIVFAGALWADWFDWELLEYTVRSCPEYDFIVIGGDTAAKEENSASVPCSTPDSIKSCKNVTFTGLLLHDELADYYKNANAAIIPFVSNSITKPCSPLKYYEYISACLPVVTTVIEDIKSLPFVYTAEDGDNLYERFAALLKKAAEHEITREEYNGLLAFADENTWEVRYRDLFDFPMLNKNLLSQESVQEKRP